MEDPDHFQINLSRSATPWDTKTKVKRGIWQFLVRPLYRLIPGKKGRLRIAILRTMGAQIGNSCTIQQRVDILIPWNLEMGDHVALAHDSRILNFATVKINSMTVISQNVHICTGSHDYSHPHFPLIYEPITIGSECWIASGAFIAPGVQIGRGSVIGANSVVTRSMAEWKVCAGNPCKEINERAINKSLTDTP